jgi:ferredoxin
MVSDMPQLLVNRDLCIGAGLCVMTAPEVFDQAEDDGLVVLLTPEPAGPARDPGTDPRAAAVREAARQCPSGALTWRD